MSFPTSPTNGQTATVNGVTYQYNATYGTWTRVTGLVSNLSVATLTTTTGAFYANGFPLAPSYTSSTTAPASANARDQWYNPSTDVLYEYVFDGVSGYWVDYSSVGAGYTTTTASITTSVIPASANTLTVGSTTYPFANVYTGNVVSSGGALSITSNGAVVMTPVGNLDISTGTINLGNGTGITSIVRTGQANGYTSAPTVIISPPTTPGGIQANVTNYIWISSVTLVSGGTGYSVNDVLSVTGGSYTANPVKITVTGVSGGVITTFTYAGYDLYNTAPSNPVSVTGGTGSSATFNLTFTNSSAYTINNAGSGYIEQPTVTFSGGGATGAAAYALVGAAPVIKTISGTLNFNTASGTQFQVADTYNGTSPSSNFVAVQGRYAGAGPVISALGSDSAVTLNLVSKGSGAVAMGTNGGAQAQAIVSHTASAVNYVNLTGAATGGRPVISSAGNDTNVDLGFQIKGTGQFVFKNSGGGVAFAVGNGDTSNPTNTLQVNSGGAGSTPGIQATGTDTNISLQLTPKGTGNVYALGNTNFGGTINYFAGNIGLGVSNPQSPLTVANVGYNQATTFYSVADFTNNAAYALGTMIGYDSGNGAVIASNGVSKPIAFWQYQGSAYGEIARFNTSGQLLIGKTAAGESSSNLEVVGIIRTNQTGGLRYRSDWGVQSQKAFLNAYDDSGSTYLPLNLTASQINLQAGTGGNIQAISVASTGAVGINYTNTSPIATLDIGGGYDSGGANGATTPGGLAMAYYGGGYRNWIRSRHNSGPSTSAPVGNAFDFYTNNSSSSGGSTAPGTGSLLAMSIDSGYVNMPNQPCFLAYGTGSTSASSNQSAQVTGWNSTAFNVNNNFNTSTSTFTCTVPGTYIFTLVMRCDGAPDSGYLRFTIGKNGATYTAPGASMCINGNMHSTDYISGTATVVFQLASGDYVQVFGGNGTGSGNGFLLSESTFSGSLLH